MPPSSQDFLSAVATSGLEITDWRSEDCSASSRLPVVPDPALEGWTWDIGSDVKTFIHDSRPRQCSELLIRSATDTIGLRIGSPDFSLAQGQTGIRYELDDTFIETSGLDLMLAFLPKGSLIRGAGPYSDRSISLIVTLDWLERTLGRQDDLLRFITAHEQGLLCHYPRVSSRIDRIVSEVSVAAAQEGPTRGLLLRAKALELLAAAFDLVMRSDPANSSPQRYTGNQRVRDGVERVTTRIRACPDRPLVPEELVKLSGLNRTTLREAFKHITGLTMLDFRTRVRMEQADLWIQKTRFSIGEIAHRLGFADSPSFINAYKRHFRRTPGESRHVAVRARK